VSAASDQITEYLSVGGLFNPEMMNQTQHEAVRDTLIKARDDIQRLERENAALREQVEELDAKWKMAEDQCFDQVGKIGELERENAALKKLIDDPNAMHEYYLRSGNGWEVWHGERLGQMENYIPELQGQIAELRKTLQLIVDKWDSCTELYTSDQDAAQNLADTAREALNRIR